MWQSLLMRGGRCNLALRREDNKGQACCPGRGNTAGCATGTESGAVCGVRLEGETVAADCVVLAMGPWSPTWLGLPQAFGTKYHSLLMRPERTLSQSVFFQG